MAIYRVDRSDNPSRVPCGMISLLHSGNVFAYAVTMFHIHEPGYDFWDHPDKSYGIVLSVWDDKSNSYRVLKHKGFPECPAQ